MSYAPLSPLDPSQSLQSAQSRSSYKPLGRQISLAPTMTRSTKGTDFFSAVYLSTTDTADDSLIEASIKLASGDTKPLRVRKKNRRIAGLGPASRHRRSNMSLPRSPRSSMDHSVSTSSSVGRSNTSSSNGSSVHPHQSISRIFMAATPILESPPVLPSPTRKRNSRRHSLASSIHSDLMFRLPYDDTPLIGPSPPSTPIDSPAASVRRSSTPPPVPSLDVPLTPDITTMYRVKPLPMPPSPVTPSRAPSKAAKLLGADAPHVPKPQGVLKGILKNGGDRAIKRDHYRPLPVQTLQEIEQFFGDVPKKSTKPTTNSQKSDTRMAGQRNLGLGSTVRHKGEGGAMWLDQQEEQEFAWLMSEVSIRNPSPIPTMQKKGPPKNAEPQWEMDNFTSVLSIKPTYSQKPRKSDKKAHGRGIGESFMDFGPEPSPTPAPSRPSQEMEPWQDAQLVKPSLKDTISAPMAHPPPLLQPPPRITSHARSASLATPPVDAFANRPITPPTQIASGRLSPPRNKKRPPPLFLHALPKNGNLPAISNTPRTPDKIHLRSVSEPVKPTAGAAKGYTKLLDLPDYIPYSPPEKQDESLKPTTPFVKPRRAPIPGYHPSAAKPQHTRYPSHGQTAFEDDISFFEPVTPTDSKPSHRKGFSNEKPVVASNKGVVGIKTGGWFRRVVKAQ